MDKINTLVLSGGGLKGIAHIGVLKALKEKKILDNITTIAGTSIGSIVGCLYNIGYSPEELGELITELDFGLLKNIKLEDIPIKLGIDGGEKIECVLKELFKNKGYDEEITFQELYQKTKIKLIFTATCTNTKELKYLSYKTFPGMKVITGMRISSSIPFLFVPVKYEGNMYIDGAVMNNYPINLFKKKKNNVIGIYLYEKNENKNINNIEEYFFSVLDCAFAGLSNVIVDKYEKQTIKLFLPQLSVVEMKLNDKLKKELYNFGYNQTLICLDEKIKN
jgi:NTE family protein